MTHLVLDSSFKHVQRKMTYHVHDSEFRLLGWQFNIANMVESPIT